jgi:hypothetical protein
MHENRTGGELQAVAAEIAKTGLSLHTEHKDGRFKAWVVPASETIDDHSASFVVEPVTRDTELDAARAALAIYQLHSELPTG